LCTGDVVLNSKQNTTSPWIFIFSIITVAMQFNSSFIPSHSSDTETAMKSSNNWLALGTPNCTHIDLTNDQINDNPELISTNVHWKR